jgi:myosin-5
LLFLFPSPLSPDQLCAGATPEQQQQWHLGPASSFRYLNQSDCFQLKGTNDAEEYKITRLAMSAVGLSGEVQDQVFRVLAALLHLGNVMFRDVAGDSSDACEVSGG